MPSRGSHISTLGLCRYLQPGDVAVDVLCRAPGILALAKPADIRTDPGLLKEALLKLMLLLKLVESMLGLQITQSRSYVYIYIYAKPKSQD